jgi:hypothetical protein
VGRTRRDKWRNNRIRGTLDQGPVLNYLERRSIKWYGHVLRMQDYRKPKQAMEAKGEKKRQRKTKEDLGGLCDGCGQEERKDFSRYEETGSR